VICLPGFCSSSLKVVKSDVMPSWVNSRVWFCLQKLARARTQRAGIGGSGASHSLTIRVHKAAGLSLSEEADRDSIDGLVVRLRLLAKDQSVLAEAQTAPIRLAEDHSWSGVATYEQALQLVSDSAETPAALHVSLIDIDTADFGDDVHDDSGSPDDPGSFGTTLISLKSMAVARQSDYTLTAGTSGPTVGSVTLTCVELIRGSAEEIEQLEEELAEAHAKIPASFGLQTDSQGATDEQTDDVDDVVPRAWMRHMLLDSDGHSDPPGIETRAVPGLAGCNYLQPGVMSAATWVFGHVTNHLKHIGYGPKNLKGATYDWRQPPMFLEQQSGYFSGLVRMVEKTYKENGNRPVVLLAHSMGCKMGHYFANWVVNNGHAEAGIVNPQAWLDKFIFSLYAVGGPFLGARKSLRGMLSGDDMGIGEFIGRLNTIRLSRGVGSGMFLYPEGPLRTANPYALAYRRDKGMMRIEIVSATLFGLASELSTDAKLSVRLRHTKTKRGHRRQTSVETQASTAEPEGSDCKVAWGQRYQLISEKLSLGDRSHESMDFDLKLYHGGAQSVIGRINTSVNALLMTRTYPAQLYCYIIVVILIHIPYIIDKPIIISCHSHRHSSQTDAQNNSGGLH
jgi:hypothetical protein